MDEKHFDLLTKHLGSRRTAIGGLLAGLLLPLEAAARKKGKQRKQRGNGKGRDKGKGKKHKRANAQAEPAGELGPVSPRKARTSVNATWRATPHPPS